MQHYRISNKHRLLTGFERVYVEAADEVRGKTAKQRQSWIQGKTWRLVERRKVMKHKIEATRSERVYRLKAEHGARDRKVKRSVRNDR